MKAIKSITLVFIASVALVSCKSNMDLTKRHYTKGYYFHKSSSIEQHATKEEVAHQSIKASEMETVKVNPKTQDTKEQKIKGGLVKTEVFNSVIEQKKNQKQNIVTRKASAKGLESFFSKRQKTKEFTSIRQKNSKSQQAKGGSDANTIILVILCLFPFINLIPVYIHDGKSVTTNFWITLLLDVLFFVPGIVFAILVVLDVVNLA